MYKLFLTLRYLRKRRIAYFAVAAVTLCVAMVLIVMSIMGGWLDQVKVRARGLLGDVIVDNAAYSGFPLYQEFIDEISAWPEIVQATPVIYTWGLYGFEDSRRNGTVRVVGIRLSEVYDVNAFKAGLFYERHYPGTTSLAAQQQPLIGVDFDGTWTPIPGEDLMVPPYALPEPYQTALEQARAAGPPEDDSTETDLNEVLAQAGLPPIPGVYGMPIDPQTPGMVGNELPGIILGRDLIARRESDGLYTRPTTLPRGWKVILTVVPISGSNTISTPIKQFFRYSDDSRTGIYEIDSQHVYCDFELLQRLVEMDEAERIDRDTGETIGTAPARCSQIQIKVAEGLAGLKLQALCRRMEKVYHGYILDERYDLDAFDAQMVGYVEAMTWQESQAHIIGPIEKERILVTILFGIVSLVAVTLVLCILYMIVLQKTRDIGIMKAIGGSSGGVALIFVMYGAAVGIAGSILGTVFGVLFVNNINAFQDFLIRVNPAWRVWDMKVYSFDRIPSQVDTFEAVVVVAVGIAASTLGSLVAAWRAGRMQPVEALRYE